MCISNKDKEIICKTMNMVTDKVNDDKGYSNKIMYIKRKKCRRC